MKHTMKHTTERPVTADYDGRSTRYWDHVGNSSELCELLWSRLVPDEGAAVTEHGEAIRAGGRINYDMGNNGGGNIACSSGPCEMFAGFARYLLALDKKRVKFDPADLVFLRLVRDVATGRKALHHLDWAWRRGDFDAMFDKVVVWAATEELIAR